MLRFIEQSGPFILVQAALALVVMVLALINAFRLRRPAPWRIAALATSIDAILFWGSLNAVLGFLGQWSGLYRGANAIFDFGVSNPNLIILGVGESLGTSVFGMFAFIVSAALWFLLRLGLRRREAAQAMSALA